MTPPRTGATAAFTALLILSLGMTAGVAEARVNTAGAARHGWVYAMASLGPFRVSCTNHLNRQVVLVADYRMGGIGDARPSRRVIRVNPRRLAELPMAVRLFWYTHECAHHRLPPPLNRSESAADCWAIKRGRDSGLLRREDAATVARYLKGLSGSRKGHLPGPLRSANVLRCFDEPLRIAGQPRRQAVL